MANKNLQNAKKAKTEVVEEVFDENNKAVVDENGNQKTEKVTREYTWQ